MGRASGGDGRGARAPRRADRRRRRGPRRELDQVDGRGRLDRVGVRLGAGRGRGRARRQPGTGRRGLAARHPHRRSLRHPHRRGRAARRATTSARASTSPRACAPGRRRRDLPLLGDQRARRGAPAGGLLAGRPRTAPLEGARRAGADPRARGPGRPHAAAGTDCPYRGLLAFEAEDRAFFFGREDVVAEARSGALAPGRLLAVVGARAAASPRSCAPAWSPPRAPARSTGIDDAVAADTGRRAGSTLPDEPDRLVIVDQFEELFTLCDDPERRDARSSTRCCACAAPS